MKVIKIID